MRSVLGWLLVGLLGLSSLHGKNLLLSIPAQDCSCGEGFSASAELLQQDTAISTYKITFPSPIRTSLPENNTVPGELFLPRAAEDDRGSHSLPAVLVFHILHGNYELERLLCGSLARAGIPAMFCKMPYFDERAGQAGRGAIFASTDVFLESFTQGQADARRAIDLLTSLPAVDAGKIGVAGTSLGAILSTSLCGNEPRIRRVAAMLGGGDLRRIFSFARETRQFQNFISRQTPPDQERIWSLLARIDPLAQAAALQNLSRRGALMLVFAENDDVIPPDCARQLATASACQNVTWLPGATHYTAIAALPGLVKQNVAFFAADLPAAASASAPAGQEALAQVAAICSAWAKMFTPPAPGKGHALQLQGSISAAAQKHQFSLSFLRHGNSFRLSGNIPELGEFSCGADAAGTPWMGGKNQRLFIGRGEAQPGRTAAQYITPRRYFRFQMGSSFLAALENAPEILNQYLDLQSDSLADGSRRLSLRSKNGLIAGEIVLTLDGAGQLRALAFDLGKYRGEIQVSQCLANGEVSVPADFPAGMQAQEVRQEDLLRMWAAIWEFFLEKIDP
ncbi:MAG: acetylxylan esterase [Oligosphaeraceae bacterium]|nr:acetylxylan esterase [Oligosphaeraceae bacterium]